MPAFFEDLDPFEPQDAAYPGKKADQEVVGVKEGKMEELPQEGDVQDEHQENDRSRENPAKGDVRGSQRGPDHSGPRSIGQDQAEVGRHQGGKGQGTGLLHALAAVQGDEKYHQENREHA